MQHSCEERKIMRMKIAFYYDKKRKKPFTRKQYKDIENLLVNCSKDLLVPITRLEARENIAKTKENHRKWFKK